MPTPLARQLEAYLQRAHRSPGQLAGLSDVPKRTIANWLDGTTRKPQSSRPLLQIAVALHLNEPETTALLQAAGHPSLPKLRETVTDANEQALLAHWPVERTQPPTPRHNLPAPVTSLVGRKAEVAQLQSLLRRPDVRLLTLIGPPGVGKTRLALQVGSALLPDFGEGVWFVPLAPLTESAQVLPLVAQTLDIPIKQGSIFDALVNHLRQRQILLLLDNFEHVGDAALTISELLAACAQLKVLVTSRKVLRLYGEHEFAVTPLAVPPLTPLPRLQELARYAAVDLFVQRAQAVRPDFTLTTSTAAAVADICVRLDGLPLAIELAAARVKQLSPITLRSHLSDHFRLLEQNLRDVPVRHRSLHSAIAWSYDLLDQAEQALLRRLAVFAGGCTLTAIEAVCNGTDLNEYVILKLLSSLLEKNLVQQMRDPNGDERFSLLETIRDYALNQLKKHREQTSARQAHAEYFVSFTVEGAVAYHTREEGVWLERLDVEHENLRGALRWILQTEQSKLGLCLAETLRRFWYARGYYQEGEAWLAQILALPEPAEEHKAYATALISAGVMAAAQGKFTDSASLHDKCLNIARRIGDRRLIADASRGLGYACYIQGKYAEARSLIEEALQIRRDLGDPHGIADALHMLGVMARQTGDYAAAREFLEEEISIFQKAGNAIGIVTATTNLAIALREQGDYITAKQLTERCLVDAKATKNPYGMANALLSLGHIAYLQGHISESRRLYEQSLNLNKEIDNQVGLADGARYLGILAWSEGNLSEAARQLKQDLQLRQVGQHKLGIVLSLAAFVGLAAALKQPWLAVQLAGAISTFQEDLQVLTLPRVEKSVFEVGLAQAKSTLTPEDASAAWAKGQIMRVDDAIAYALLAEDVM